MANVVELANQGVDLGGAQLCAKPVEVEQQAQQSVLLIRSHAVPAEPTPRVVVGQAVGISPGIQQLPMNRNGLVQPRRKSALDHVVQPDFVDLAVPAQDADIVEWPYHLFFDIEFVHLPDVRKHAHGYWRVLREDGYAGDFIGNAREPLFGKLQSHLNRSLDSGVSRLRIMPIETEHTAPLEELDYVADAFSRSSSTSLLFL